MTNDLDYSSRIANESVELTGEDKLKSMALTPLDAVVHWIEALEARIERVEQGVTRPSPEAAGLQIRIDELEVKLWNKINHNALRINTIHEILDTHDEEIERIDDVELRASEAENDDKVDWCADKIEHLYQLVSQLENNIGELQDEVL